jgi:NhaA family Na+:H+ antiporter
VIKPLCWPAMTGSRATSRLRALREFLRQEAVAGVVLLAAAVAAMICANSAASGAYTDFWQRELTLGFGFWAITEDLGHWVNDALMTVFFFVVGLEIKRELAVGELRQPRAAALPIFAALGGVILPALIYVTIIALAGEPDGAEGGWGIPMATDIAFAVGVLSLLGARAADGSKLLLLSIAIVDDILAIIVIAAFYSGPVRLGWLGGAVLIFAVIALMRRFFVSPWAYVLPALVAWYAVFESGLHATLAGVALGLLTPATPIEARRALWRPWSRRLGSRRPSAGRSVIEGLEHVLHPVSAYLIVPIFAFANAGVDLRGGALVEAVAAPLTWAIAAGLVVGKTLGIAGLAFGVRRLGWAALPARTPAVQVWPVAALGGIGFTVALFIADLAFDDERLIANAKVGIFAGSATAALLGLGLLLAVSWRPGASSPGRAGN